MRRDPVVPKRRGVGGIAIMPKAASSARAATSAMCVTASESSSPARHARLQRPVHAEGSVIGTATARSRAARSGPPASDRSGGPTVYDIAFMLLRRSELRLSEFRGRPRPPADPAPQRGVPALHPHRLLASDRRDLSGHCRQPGRSGEQRSHKVPWPGCADGCNLTSPRPREMAARPHAHPGRRRSGRQVVDAEEPNLPKSSFEKAGPTASDLTRASGTALTLGIGDLDKEIGRV